MRKSIRYSDQARECASQEFCEPAWNRVTWHCAANSQAGSSPGPSYRYERMLHTKRSRLLYLPNQHQGIDNSIGSRTKTSLQKMMRCLTTSIVHHAAAARSESTCCHATITFQIKQRQNKYQWFDRDASYLPGRQVAIHLNLMGETGPAYLGAEDEVGLTLGSPPLLLM
jgi:hypothetical protein